MRLAASAAAVLAAFLVAAATACSGSVAETEADQPATTTETGPSTSTETGPSTSTATETVAEPLAEGEGWASRREKAWLAQVGAWRLELSRAGTSIEALFADEERQEALVGGDDELIARYEELVEPLRRCTESFRARVGAPPTQRLLEAAELFEAACEHHAAAVEASLEAFSEQDRDDAEQARIESEEAWDATLLANRELPPGEAQELPILDEPTRRSRINPSYGQAAGSLVEMAVEVRCWSKRDWARLLTEASLLSASAFRPGNTFGYTAVGGSRVNLAPVVCRQLDRLHYGGARPTDFHGRLLMSLAVGALAHEAQHREGVADEPAAECYGMQRLAQAARALGAGRAYAEGLADLAWQTYDRLPRGYRSPECRDGGELDLELPGEGAWP